MKNQIEFVLSEIPGGTRFVSTCDSFVIYSRTENASAEEPTWCVRQRATTNRAAGLTYDEAVQQANKWVAPRTFNAETEELTITNAPKDYDYGQTWQVQSVGFDTRGREIRIVASPAGYQTTYQRGRYGSGLYMACSPSDWETVKPYTLKEAAL